MPLLDLLQKDLLVAMKAKDDARLSAIRMAKAALMKAKVDSPKPLDEAAELKVLASLIKQRVDAAEMYRKAGREDSALKEEAEKLLIESYMPASATPKELDAAIAAALTQTGATTAKQMGAVMNAVKAVLEGKRIDGKLLSEKVKARLA
jgi:uncharacterized protein YqeY